MIDKVIKRDGSFEDFIASRVINAVLKAMRSVNLINEALARKVPLMVNSRLNGSADVEVIQDLIIDSLNELGLGKVATSYSLYRERRALSRDFCKSHGIVDELKLSVNALRVLKERYLLPGESIRGLFDRVANFVAGAENLFGGDAVAMRDLFLNMMCSLEFLPSSPFLMNAGTKLNQLSSCFVLPVNDSLEGIFSSLKEAVLIHHSGGGVGFNFSSLRPYGDFISSSGGRASGPLSFINVFDSATNAVMQGGKRRGANMAVLNHDHPDIIDFINAKRSGGLSNFNLSVSVTDSFMNKVVNGSNYFLVNPRGDSKVRKVNASDVFNELCANAWLSGDPGLIFIDEINRKHPLSDIIKATNPCAEVPLLDYEACFLGSINVSRFFNEGIDWSRLDRVVRLAVRFLDNAISVTSFPLPNLKEKVFANRKIGLGIMGFADLLIQLGVPYDSRECLVIVNRLMKFVNDKARDESMRLGLKRGSFPNFNSSKLRGNFKAMRNATVTALAPTGTISIIADCSSGIEPLFALSYTRDFIGSKSIIEVNRHFLMHAVRNGFYSENIIIPSKFRPLFSTALSISPEWHIKVQSTFQKFVDNAISKTVNLPEDSSIKQVRDAFILAWKLKCKGVTVYRDNSKSSQVLNACKGSCD